MAKFDIPPPAEHVEETVRSIAQLRAEHRENATHLQRWVDRVTASLARPAFLAVVAVVVIGWITLNWTVAAFGGRAIDPPTFPWLEVAVSLLSLFMVVLILAAQRHEDQLAQRREMLILEIVLLSEQKTAKVIQLLEEFRRDNPLVRDRHDPEAATMAQPTDPSSVVEVLKQTNVSSPK
jgi:uncharacterized membrane protein